MAKIGSSYFSHDNLRKNVHVLPFHHNLKNIFYWIYFYRLNKYIFTANEFELYFRGVFYRET